MARPAKSLMEQYKPPPGTFVWRVAQLVDTSGRSATDISSEAGSRDIIRDIFRRPEQSKTITVIERLAEALETSAEYLLFGHPDAHAAAAIELAGEVNAGSFRLVDLPAQGKRFARVQIPPAPRFPAIAQFDLIVRGESINRIAREGDYLRCLSLSKSGQSARHGDLVIVERRRAQEGDVETTAKRLRDTGSHIELWPESDDPFWRAPMIIRKDHRSSDEQISITALVLFIFRDTSDRNTGG
jgi:SOS-response transcriptional repressor LexA